MIKVVRLKTKEKNKIISEFSLPEIQHDLSIMISKYQNKILYLGKTQAILNQLSAQNYISGV